MCHHASLHQPRFTQPKNFCMHHPGEAHSHARLDLSAVCCHSRLEQIRRSDDSWHFEVFFTGGWALCWWIGWLMLQHGANTGASYQWHYEDTEIPPQDPEAHCCAIVPKPSPHVAALTCSKDLYIVPENREHPSSCKAGRLTVHASHWACLGCFGSG